MKNIKLFSRSKKDPDTLTARSMILPIAFCLVCGVLLILFGKPLKKKEEPASEPSEAEPADETQTERS